MSDIVLKKANAKDFDKIKKLYLTAFPKEERKPIYMVKSKLKHDKAEMYLAYAEDKICGFAYMLKENDIVLVDYLAIDESLRGRGIGSLFCKELPEIYADKCLFLEIEMIGEQYENNQQRIKRKHFYLKNGLKETGIAVDIYKTQIELLTFNRQLSYNEFICFMKKAYKIMYPILRIKNINSKKR